MYQVVVVRKANCNVKNRLHDRLSLWSAVVGQCLRVHRKIDRGHPDSLTYLRILLANFATVFCPTGSSISHRVSLAHTFVGFYFTWLVLTCLPSNMADLFSLHIAYHKVDCIIKSLWLSFYDSTRTILYVRCSPS